MDQEKIAELLEIYMDLVAKQDEVIYILSRLVNKLQLENAQFRDVLMCEETVDEELNEAMRKVNEYNKIKDV